MLFLLLCILFLSQVVVYLVFKIIKKTLNRWVSLAYTILDVIMVFPIGFIVLFMAVMSTDSGTEAAERGAKLFIAISAIIYLAIFFLSLLHTIKAFKEYGHRVDQEQENKKPN